MKVRRFRGVISYGHLRYYDQVDAAHETGARETRHGLYIWQGGVLWDSVILAVLMVWFSATHAECSHVAETRRICSEKYSKVGIYLSGQHLVFPSLVIYCCCSGYTEDVQAGETNRVSYAPRLYTGSRRDVTGVVSSRCTWGDSFGASPL